MDGYDEIIHKNTSGNSAVKLAIVPWTRNNTWQEHPSRQGTLNGTSHVIQEVLERYITTTICVLGFFGNIVNLLVLTRARYQKSQGMKETGAHIGLVALAVSDMLFCLVMFPRGFMEEKVSLFSSKDFWLYYQAYGTGLVTTLILTSTWITCTMTVLRYVGICHPLKARNIDSPKFARIAYAAVFISCVAFNTPSFFQYKISDIIFEGKRHYLIDIGYMDIKYPRERIFTWFKIMFAIIIPATILICCNFSLVRALRRSYKMRRECYVKDTQNATRNRITLTLIIIATSFVVLVFPCELVDLDFFSESIENDLKKTEVFLLLRTFANAMQVTNFSLNFVLYCVINVHFRSTIRDMMLFWRNRSLRGSSRRNSDRFSPNHKLTRDRFMSVLTSTTTV